MKIVVKKTKQNNGFVIYETNSKVIDTIFQRDIKKEDWKDYRVYVFYLKPNDLWEDKKIEIELPEKNTINKIELDMTEKEWTSPRWKWKMVGSIKAPFRKWIFVNKSKYGDGNWIGAIDDEYSIYFEKYWKWYKVKLIEKNIKEKLEQLELINWKDEEEPF